MLETIAEHRCFGGTQAYYRHDSKAVGLPMRFSVYVPPQAEHGKVPALFYLPGLTCTEETFMIKAGAQRVAAQLGMLLVSPDTSPRDAKVAGEADDWDFGLGAGFYVDATQPPWARHYRMYSYVLELAELVKARFPVLPDQVGITGHSMGGHGALVLGLRNRAVFRTVSAFAPVAAPSVCPWGRKAFGNYLGADEAAWAPYDATALMLTRQVKIPSGILIDQGTNDKFLAEQLYPDRFQAACRQVGQPLELRMHEGYDHGYYFVASFIEEHLLFHFGNGMAGV
jgi:S-formylglutathione hydrolase